MKENIGHFIKRKRQELGLTQTELAYKLKMDAAKLSKIENCRLNLDEKRIKLLSDVFNIKEDEVKKLYYADRIAHTMYSNNCSKDTLQVAEEMLEYYKQTGTKQGKIDFNK